MLLMIFAIGCSCKCDLNEEKLHDAVIKKYGDNVEILLNDENNFALVVEKKKPTPYNPSKTVNFFIFDLVNNLIVYEKTNYNGNVSWISNNQIEMKSIPGTIQYDQDKSNNVIIYDLILEKEIRK